MLALFAGLASAQIGTPGTTPLGPTMICTTTVVPTTLRSESITDPIGDIVLTCTGGIAPAQGSNVVQGNFAVTLGTVITSRILTVNSQTASEALLLIDEPGTTSSTAVATVPGFGPAATQIPCTTPNSGCAAFVSQVGGIGVACATNVASCAAPAANVFYGLLNTNSFQVTWNGVPILPPTTSGLSRVFRMTNIRANGPGVAAGLGGVGQLQASVQIQSSQGISVNNSILTVGNVQSGLTTARRTFTGGSQSTVPNFLQCNSVSLGFPGFEALRYTENFASAFKTRVVPAATNSPANSGQGTTVSQNIPGQVIYSESDFVLNNSNASATPGLADFGTRLRAVFSNIPNGVQLYVTTTNINSGAQVASTATPFAQLVLSETAPESAFTPVTGTTNSITYFALPISGNTATAVWEVITANPLVNESFDFGVALSFTGNQNTNTPPPGTATVDMSFAPVIGPQSASSTAPIPRFVDNNPVTNSFTVALCQTALLFPYVTNASGLETGIAIANTSKDPLGKAVAQSGTCSLNFYGNATVAAVTVPLTGASNVNILSGNANTNANDWAFTLSSLPGMATNFQGYMIALCNFQFAHGFAFISDIGTRNLAMGYLALVLDDQRGYPVPERLEN
ncbi:MAG TPA: hypothetical protein VGF59_35820 [Bryobacteraceae bacterium]